MIAQRFDSGAERVRTTLREILERERIPAEEREPHWLVELLSRLFGDVEAVSAGVYFFLLLAVAALAVLLFVYLNGKLRPRSVGASGATSGGGEAVRLRVAELVGRARRAADSGDCALAVRLHLFALVVGLSEHGDLEFRPSWTNRELIERGRPPAEVREAVQRLLDDLEPKTFGRETATESDVRRVESLAARLLGGAAA